MAIAILGLGKTGLSLAKHFHSQGKEVWGIDDQSETAMKDHSAHSFTSRLFLGGEYPPWPEVEKFFISPGVDPKHTAAQEAAKHGLSLEGELDLAFSLCHGEVIAITGTNGKSTTTSLVGNILKAAGIKAGVGGNLGTPFLDLVTGESDYSHYVVEVSSFQLESIRKFSPHIAILLNLSDDHLDRHPNLQEYLRAKRRIFDFQTENDYAIYNDDDLHTLEATRGIQAKKIPFSTAKKVSGAYGKEEEIQWAPEGTVISTFKLSQCSLKGLHNLENISAAVATAKALNISDEPIQKAIDSFEGLPHRIQWVAKVNGVTYYDDSKATNVGAVVMSLASFDQDVALILGGKDKGGDYSLLRPLLKAKAKCIIVLGEATEKISTSLKGSTEIYPVPNMEAAVHKARALTPKGGTVLLSPACSSFDQYKNYKERGLDFQHWVKQLESS